MVITDGSANDDTAEFGRLLTAARTDAHLSPRKLSRVSGVPARRISDLEQGDAMPTDRELGALAQGCGRSIFDLLPPGYGLRLLDHAESNGARELTGRDAIEALLQEYVSMVVELRSGRAVTAPTLRHDDLVELAAALGDTPETIETRLVELLDSNSVDANAIRSLILPSTATE